MISDQPGVLYRWSSQRVPVAAPTTTAAWSGLQLGPLVRMYQMVSSAECPSRRYVQMSRPRAINVSRSMRTPPAVAVMTKAVSEMNFSSSGEGGSFGGGGGGGGWGGDGEFDGEGEVDCDADALALGDEEGAVGVAVAWVVSSVSSRCDPTTITAATAISAATPSSPRTTMARRSAFELVAPGVEPKVRELQSCSSYGWVCAVHFWPSHHRRSPGSFGSLCQAGG